MRASKTPLENALLSGKPRSILSEQIGIDILEEDLYDAMSRIPGYLDIFHRGLCIIYHLAHEHAIERLLGALRARGHASRGDRYRAHAPDEDPAPPRGATALIAVIGGDQVHGLGFLYVLAPTGAGAVILLTVALVGNYIPRTRRYPEVWFQLGQLT